MQSSVDSVRRELDALHKEELELANQLAALRGRARKIFRDATNELMPRILLRGQNELEAKFGVKGAEVIPCNCVYVALDEDIRGRKQHTGSNFARCRDCGKHIPEGGVYVITASGKILNSHLVKEVEDEDNFGNEESYRIFRLGEEAENLKACEISTILQRLVDGEYTIWAPSSPII